MARRTFNKSAWIRAQPASLAAKDLVAKAKREGISLSLAQVYTARSIAVKAQAGASSSVRAVPAQDSTRLGGGSGSQDHRAKFQQIAIRLGLDEAQRLLQEIAQRALARV